MRPLAPVLILLALSGCAAEPDTPPRASVASGIPATLPGEARLALRFPPGLSVLGTTEAIRLDHFLEATRVRRGDTVTLETPTGSDALSRRRRAALEDQLSLRGLRARFAASPEPRADVVTLVADRSEAQAEECPAAPDPTGRSGAPAGIPPFGCATAWNLARQIARPADLRRGDDPGPYRLPPAGAVSSVTTSAIPPGGR